MALNISFNELSNDTGIVVHCKFDAPALPLPNTNSSRLELAFAC